MCKISSIQKKFVKKVIKNKYNKGDHKSRVQDQVHAKEKKEIQLFI